MPVTVLLSSFDVVRETTERHVGVSCSGSFRAESVKITNFMPSAVRASHSTFTIWGKITKSNITLLTNVLAVVYCCFYDMLHATPTGPKLHFLSVLCKRFYDDGRFNDARFKIMRTSVNFNISVILKVTRAGQHTERPSSVSWFIQYRKLWKCFNQCYHPFLPLFLCISGVVAGRP